MVQIGLGLPARRNDAAFGTTALAATRRYITRFRCGRRCRSRCTRQMLIAAFHPSHDWPELDAEFLRNLSPTHILAAQSQDALQQWAGSYAGAAGLPDSAADQRSIQLLGRRLRNPHRIELLLCQRQRNVNIAETHVARRRSNQRGCSRRYRYAAGHTAGCRCRRR